MSYPFAEIEKKWQQFWETNQTFATGEDFSKPKYYVLDMFPYPSGAGLHVGHPEGYTATDIIARKRRMQGFNVLHPMGWDAFGLPAERYAMQTGIHPSITTKQNIDNFRRQLKSLGFSYDWSREVDTTSPDYYKFTQWIFLKLFNSWYDTTAKKARPISELKIPPELAGDAKKKEREDFIANHRLAYIANMPVNWCAELGTVLANEEVDEWVGKGYKVERKPMRQWMLRITAYAERLLVDLEHVDWPAGTLELQKNWIGQSTGALVSFKVDSQPDATLQVFTTRPDTLYGVTFMVLAPEHPLVDKIAADSAKTEIETYRKTTALKTDLDRQLDAAKKEKTGVAIGAHAIHPLTGEKVPLYIADYVLMGYGTGAIMAVPAHDERDFAFAQQFGIAVKQVVKAAAGETELPYAADGIAVNSPIFDGLKTAEAKAKIIEHLEKEKLGERRIQYKLRDWLFSRQRYWGEPVPVSFDEDGFMVADNEDELPLLLPESKNFQPAGTGESPLANLPEWVNFEKNGRKLRRETNTMPQWAGSSWYYLRFADPANTGRFAAAEKEKYWLNGGVDLYVGGAEHAVLHLLYARFWHKVLYDLGYVSSIEPFKKLVHQGIILGEDGSKMSKSRGNVVNPDTVVAEYGADTFRLYEMFMGPLEQMKPWSSKSIEGIYRFLARVYRLYFGNTNSDENAGSAPKLNDKLLAQPADEKAVLKVLHQTIKKVSDDIETLSLNTAISQMMIFVNEAYRVESIGKDAATAFIKLLAPFAPHMAEEIWQALGEKGSVALAEWPKFDATHLVESSFEAVIQINGKIRGRTELAMGISDADFESAARGVDAVKAALEGKTVRKVIVVKNKMINFVVG